MTRVAVIIPCFNQGRFVREAVESVRRQDWPHVECVVVDDGSTDPGTVWTLDELAREGIRLVRQENRGLPAARNAGVRSTETPLFVCLDADDRIAPTFISRLLPRLLDDPGVGYCYCWTRFFGARSGRWRCPEYDPKRLLLQNLSPATAVVRRAAFDQVGGYRETMTHGYEDWDLWLGLLAAGYAGACVPETLFFYRKHPPGRSMLHGTLRRHSQLVGELVDHHRPLFAAQLGAPGERDEDILPLLGVEVELNLIETFGPWRFMQRVPGIRQQPRSDDASRAERLARIKRSPAYQLIVAAKSTPFYALYAHRAHGPAWRHGGLLGQQRVESRK